MREATEASNPTASDVQESAVIAELQRIADQHDGMLNPDAVVDVARDPGNPLHEYFSWDDTSAAENWRRAQAGALIRRVKLTIIKQVDPEKAVMLNITREAVTTRRYQSRPSARTDDGGYEQVADIMADPVKRQEMVATALRELRGIQQRYSQLTELAAVWKALDKAG